mmetsp:Transcript_24671/g.31390  ORF Transcript_24671/g.31390 Transcript_24671/m.31390 type:complete len:160 (-) Transcript_24671:1949-2428(-)
MFAVVLSRASVFVVHTVKRKLCSDVKTVLFRGVDPSHVDYSDALQGIVRPSQARLSEKQGKKFPCFEDRSMEELFDIAEDHHHSSRSATGSPFTSWTRSKEVAKHYAGTTGVILTATVGKEIEKCFPSPNDWGEDEILVYGSVRNAALYPKEPVNNRNE